MAKFLTGLCVYSGDSDDEWILNKPLIYNSDILGQIIVPAGFRTDLASVPRVPIVYSMWGGRAHHEAVIHDALYRSDFRPWATYTEANDIFYEAMVARGKPWYVRWPMYWGVCVAGWPCFHKRKMEA